MRTLVIDDELQSCEVSLHLLKTNCPDLEILGYECKPELALKLIKSEQVDLILLDVEMPGLNGFELLEKLPEPKPAVIFTTAYDQFALDAFSVGAHDYLLKPIIEEDLIRAVNRVKERVQPPVETELSFQLDKLAIGSIDGIELIDYEDILHCQSESNYTRIFKADGSVNLVSKTLKEVESKLPSGQFLRVHNSHLVQIRSITKYIKGSGGILMLKGGHEVPVSRQKKPEVLALFGQSQDPKSEQEGT